MVCNVGMESAQKIIDRLGGPAKLAEKLGLSGRPGQIQRISNWKKRGIPARVMLDHPHVFELKPPPRRRSKKEAAHA